MSDRQAFSADLARLAGAGVEHGPTRHAYRSMPRGGAPRLIVPDHGPSARHAVARLAATYPPAKRLTAAVLGRWLTVGWPRRALTGPAPEGDPDDDRLPLVEWLADVLGRPVRIGWFTSLPRSTRKPVYLVFDESGFPIAVVKVGVDPLTERLVAAEVDALRHLGAVATGSVEAPPLLHDGTWNGHPTVVQGALPPPSLLSRRGPDLYTVVRDIAATGAGLTLPIAESDFAAELLRRLEALQLAGIAERLATVLDAPPVPFGAWHGDLNPGNLQFGGHKVQVWDWERYDRCRPVGFDLLHLELADRMHRRHVPPAHAAKALFDEAPSLLAPLGVEPTAARAVALSYFAEVAVRAVSDGQAAHGWGLARPNDWLLPLVAQRAAVRHRPQPEAFDEHADRPDVRAAAFGVLRHAVRATGRATARARREPDFLIVGAQRCGTTSLFKALAQHPDVIPPLLHKGVHYFDAAYDRGWDWYVGHFPLRRRRQFITGESSPYYLFHPLAAERIARDLPEVRTIVLVRDPVERALSAHAHELARGFETADLRTALALEEERTRGEAERMRTDPSYDSFSLRHHAYRARGRYVTQLRRLEQAIGRDRILVVDSADFFSDPESVFPTITEHLGLRPVEGITFERHNARTPSPMPPDLEAMLRDHFEHWDNELAGWWGRTPSWRR